MCAGAGVRFRVRRSSDLLLALLGAGARHAYAVRARDPGTAALRQPLLLRVRLGHLTTPAHLREPVLEHVARTEGEPMEVLDASARADGVEAWAHPQIALRWSERRLRSELEPAEGFSADLDGLPS
ncbi:hypothetical protein [Streptomyces sp. KLOTTS4A1]|uniref:hypothetical protein n=1 Tax=Streptomyces sp. KLOTTS4A1 TaxID=3390996 RepID=UPI0039F55A68